MNTRKHFPRTVCDCPDCRDCCKSPGFMIPSDLPGLSKKVRNLGSKLLASLRTKVMIGDRLVSIPTLVPQTKPEGGCVFLKNGKCSIHAVAPFGCSHFDTHMTFEEGNKRLQRGLYEIVMPSGPQQKEYETLWKKLWLAGQRKEAFQENKQ